jgi:thioredoxin-like negative regulator of GroEL
MWKRRKSGSAKVLGEAKRLIQQGKPDEALALLAKAMSDLPKPRSESDLREFNRDYAGYMMASATALGKKGAHAESILAMEAASHMLGQAGETARAKELAEAVAAAKKMHGLETAGPAPPTPEDLRDELAKLEALLRDRPG